MNTVKTQKQKQSTEMSDWWRGLTPEEQVQWYRKQKRKDATRGQARDMECTNTAVSEDVHSHTRGRKRIHELVPYGVYFSRQSALGKTQQTIDTEWRNLILDPENSREYVTIQRKKELCIELFACIQKYEDEKDTLSVGSRREVEISSAQQMRKEMEEQVKMFNQAKAEHEMVGAPVLEPSLPDEGTRDIEIAKHLMPKVPLCNQVQGLDHDSGVASKMLCDLEASERTEAQIEEEWRAEAGEFTGSAASKKAKKLLAKKLDLSKDIITVIVDIKWTGYGNTIIKKQFVFNSSYQKFNVYKSIETLFVHLFVWFRINEHK
jgi:hypothetical protein